MQDRLREIEGTLARTKERKNTILYKLSKRRQEEERLAGLGVQKLPTNPSEVEDERVIKYVVYRLKQEIGDKTAQLRDPKLLNIERDGEAVVRAKNDEVNKLIARKAQWEARLAFLVGEPAPQRARRKVFLGCAKQLPEATAPTGKRTRDESSGEEADDGSSDGAEGTEPSPAEQPDGELATSRDLDYLENVKWLGSAEADAELVRIEREAEAKARAGVGAPVARSETHALILSYRSDGKLAIPDEEHFKKQLLEERKKALQQRLSLLRGKS